MEKISIIIPAYNSEKYIEKCVNSVVNQSYQDIEILIINDGSTDKTALIVNKIIKYDKRVHLINKENGGVSSARNLGLKYVAGEYVIFVDSDDELEIDMIARLYEMINNTNSDIAHCGYKRVNESGSIIKEVSGSGIVLEQSSLDAIRCMLEGQYFVGGLWNKLFRYTIVKGISFDEDLKNHEDILFNVLAFRKASKIVFFDETKYLYYEHASSACNQLTDLKQSRDALIAAERMFNSCGEENELSVLKKHLILTKLEHLKILVMNNMEKTAEANAIKTWLKQNREYINLLGKKTKINYWVLKKSSVLYRLLYKGYDRLRTPNWDVKKEF